MSLSRDPLTLPGGTVITPGDAIRVAGRKHPARYFAQSLGTGGRVVVHFVNGNQALCACYLEDVKPLAKPRRKKGESHD